MFLGRATAWYNMLKGNTDTHVRKPVSRQHRNLIHMKHSQSSVLGKKSDWVGKKTENITGELKFCKRRNWEFSKEIGTDKTWN